MILAIILVLIALWALGFLSDLGGNLIHLVLIGVLIVLVYHFVAGRRSV